MDRLAYRANIRPYDQLTPHHKCRILRSGQDQAIIRVYDNDGGFRFMFTGSIPDGLTDAERLTIARQLYQEHTDQH